MLQQTVRFRDVEVIFTLYARVAMDYTEAADLVTTSTPAEGVWLITLNRPEKRNALSQRLIRQFLQALSDGSADPAIHAIVITGQGEFFCGTYWRRSTSPTYRHTVLGADGSHRTAGADLNDIALLDATKAREIRYLEDLCRGMADVDKPVIAAVNGPAVSATCPGESTPPPPTQQDSKKIMKIE